MPVPSRTQLQGGLIVSVQAPEGSPMRHPDVIAAMAEASLRNGATGVRLESPEHIGAVRNRCPNALIIGLWKRTLSRRAPSTSRLAGTTFKRSGQPVPTSSPSMPQRAKGQGRTTSPQLIQRSKE